MTQIAQIESLLSVLFVVIFKTNRAMMKSVKIVRWREADGMWLGYLASHPHYWTQGETFAELEENLHDIYSDIQAGLSR